MFYRTFFRHQHMLRQSLMSELRQKYAGSVLGSLWMFLYPVCLFSIYVIVYLFIFRVKPPDMTSGQYVVYVLSGLVPFLSFSEALTSGSLSLVSKQSLLVNTVYPSEFIPFQAVLSSHVNIMIGMGLLLFINIVFMGHISSHYLLLPILVIAQIMFVAGIVWVLSIISLVAKDIAQLLPLIIMILMIMSPIAYSPSMVPSSLKFILWCNPFSYFVRAYQDIFVLGEVGINFYGVVIISILVFSLGYLFFNRVKEAFYDYV
jgi:lipopolysaccharide transport system permease protein